MVASAPFDRRVPFDFATPTAFSQGGGRHLPLPHPDLMLRSWAARWNRYAPPKLAIADDRLARVVERNPQTIFACSRLITRMVSSASSSRRSRG